MPLFLKKIIMTGLLSTLGNLVYAEVVVVVPNESPIQELTSLQLSDIYLGRLTQLPGGEPVRPIDQTEQTPAHGEFYQQYLGRTPAQIRSHWSRLIFTGRGQPPKAVRSNDDMARELSRNPNTIGYMAPEAVPDSLRILTIGS
ncbi:hypothetical protein EDC38_0153 [Marinimicrobium koreense]|uniref:Phosphate ABC transporter substrate-binding protein n=1 Tax=Marinimicrobium koreense TaxID=306545 RepID=A0A3N1NUM7_9GAMM|nr:phosphate ABC transporter substrate-binding protein [Marinimicrobium koreense]ROQ19569.1 hypothetical protein EDC38_0153 [Marinimicrobium koreense]